MTPRAKQVCYFRAAQILICAVLFCELGCQAGSIRSTDVLEARLRDLQDSNDQLVDSKAELETELGVVRRENSILRAEVVQQGLSASGIVQAVHTLSRVDRIAVAPLLSGGLDRDDVPGDELISVLVTPQDASGETHRVAGQLTLRLLDYSRAEGAQSIAVWSYDETQCDALWHSGFIGRGFRMIVPLPNHLVSRDVTAHVRFTTVAGDQFDATHQLRVTPQQRLGLPELGQSEIGQ